MKRTVRDIPVQDRRVLVRVDFNVPLDKQGKITSDARIQATLPTLKYLIKRGARIILCSHLGRPKGKEVDGLRLAVAAEHLSALLKKRVAMAHDCIGTEVEKQVKNLQSGDLLLLENLRFHPEEEANDDSFAQSLGCLADLYVNDAFGASHRAHASVVGVPKYLPAVAGLFVEKELEVLGSLLENPLRPFCAMFGGVKVSDKIGTLDNIINKTDSLLIGGAMAAIFLKAKSYDVGQSPIDNGELDIAARLMEKATIKGVKVLLPIDAVIADQIGGATKIETVSVEYIWPNMRIADIGPQTIQIFQKELERCKTIFWNGPVGVYEIPLFANGTKNLAHYLAGLEATTVIGGGSTAEVMDDLNLADKVSFVSTGGGASLTYLGRAALPGVEVLPDK